MTIILYKQTFTKQKNILWEDIKMSQSKKNLLIKAIESIDDESKIRIIYYYVINLRMGNRNRESKKE